MKYLLLTLTFILSGIITAQGFTDVEKLQGYSVTVDEVIFVFDPNIYNVNPEKVVVTGSFRNWDQNMNDNNWVMDKSDEIWTLKISNANFEKIYPNEPFKFRIDDGEWMSPPADAPNEKGGNLTFMQDFVVPGLKAELKNPHTIWAEITGERLLKKDAYKLTDAKGIEIPIAGVLPNTSTGTLITTAEPMDIKRVYFLEIPSLGLKEHCSYDGWFRTLYSDKELGANIHNGETTIRLFAPRADMVKVYLYKGKDDKEAYETVEMNADEFGVWEAYFDKNLKGIYYDFTIHGAEDPGNRFYEVNPVHITDPYARVSDDTWGKARIWEKTTPATPLKNGIPKMKDLISYEVHVQDFTDRLPVEEKYKGRFKAMHMPRIKKQQR